ncbi:MAG TPA: CTP synthase [Verrucomicrobiae bacterium]|jgi:CTP synthase
MASKLVGLIGDYSPEKVAHRAIPRALELARTATRRDIAWRWIETSDLRDPSSDLAECAGVWVAPGSPYKNTEGVLDSIRWAREQKRPFLGTCGGFQHALLEFGRNVARISGAEHGETAPDAETLLITRLSCSLVEKAGNVRFVPGSRLRAAYGMDEATEGYHCNFGLNPAFQQSLERAGMRFTAFDAEGAVRGAELPDHPFFVGTLFQPERAALRNETPPIVKAFVDAL